MLHIYFGDGKGKTSAAVGLAVRAAGADLSVLFTQFLKSGGSSERNVLSNVQNITLSPCPQHVKFTFLMDRQELSDAKTYYSRLFDEVTSQENINKYDMIVLDEVFSLLDCKLMEEEKLLSFLQCTPSGKEFVLTGHSVPEKFLTLCDYCSEIKKISHPYDKGAAARRGIEY